MLAISSSLVEMMGGKLDVESTVGEGSRFFFSINLPVDENEKERPAPPKDLNGAKVLVVDDNEVNRSILTENLQAWNFDAAACASAQQAENVLRSAHSKNARVDLIILDYHMPEVNGAQFANNIRYLAEFASIPIIMLTSVDYADDGSTFSSLGIEDHLSKPARSQALLDLIVSVLQKHGAQETTAPIPQPIVTPEMQREWESGEFQPVIEPAEEPLDILIAEDNEVNRVVFTQILLDTTYSFKIAQNGREALEFFERYKPHLFF